MLIFANDSWFIDLFQMEHVNNQISLTKLNILHQDISQLIRIEPTENGYGQNY